MALGYRGRLDHDTYADGVFIYFPPVFPIFINIVIRRVGLSEVTYIALVSLLELSFAVIERINVVVFPFS